MAMDLQDISNLKELLFRMASSGAKAEIHFYGPDNLILDGAKGTSIGRIADDFVEIRGDFQQIIPYTAIRMVLLKDRM